MYGYSKVRTLIQIFPSSENLQIQSISLMHYTVHCRPCSLAMQGDKGLRKLLFEMAKTERLLY